MRRGSGWHPQVANLNASLPFCGVPDQHLAHAVDRRYERTVPRILNRTRELVQPRFIFTDGLAGAGTSFDEPRPRASLEVLADGPFPVVADRERQFAGKACGEFAQKTTHGKFDELKRRR